MNIFFSRIDVFYLFIIFLVIFVAGFLYKTLLHKRFFRFFGMKKYSKKEAIIKPVLLFFSAVFLFCALAKPVYHSKLESYNYLFFIDVSYSMLCLDYEKDGKKIDRLEMAKMNIMNLIEELSAGSRLGVILFAGETRANYGYGMMDDSDYVKKEEPLPDINTEEGYNEIISFSDKRELVLPFIPPQDVKEIYHELRQMIAFLGPWVTWIGGSPIQDALVRIGEITSGFGKNFYGDGLVIIFLTDGEEHLGINNYFQKKRFFPLKIKGTEIGDAKLFIGGLGSTEGAPVPIYNEKMEIKDYVKSVGGQVISSIDEKRMIEIASKFDGAQYKRLENVDDLNFLAHDESFKLTKHEVNMPIGWMFSLASAVLLVLFMII